MTVRRVPTLRWRRTPYPMVQCDCLASERRHHSMSVEYRGARRRLAALKRRGIEITVAIGDPFGDWLPET